MLRSRKEGWDLLHIEMGVERGEERRRAGLMEGRRHLTRKLTLHSFSFCHAVLSSLKTSDNFLAISLLVSLNQYALMHPLWVHKAKWQFSSVITWLRFPMPSQCQLVRWHMVRAQCHDELSKTCPRSRLHSAVAPNDRRGWRVCNSVEGSHFL